MKFKIRGIAASRTRVPPPARRCDTCRMTGWRSATPNRVASGRRVARARTRGGSHAQPLRPVRSGSITTCVCFTSARYSGMVVVGEGSAARLSAPPMRATRCRSLRDGCVNSPAKQMRKPLNSRWVPLRSAMRAFLGAPAPYVSPRSSKSLSSTHSRAASDSRTHSKDTIHAPDNTPQQYLSVRCARCVSSPAVSPVTTCVTRRPCASSNSSTVRPPSCAMSA